MRTLHAVLKIELHVVAQIIEPELVVGSVGDVAGVVLLPFGIIGVTVLTVVMPRLSRNAAAFRAFGSGAA